MTPASQLGTPISVCVIESRACHVTLHRVFLWDHTAFDTLLSLFTLAIRLSAFYEICYVRAYMYIDRVSADYLNPREHANYNR